MSSCRDGAWWWRVNAHTIFKQILGALVGYDDEGAVEKDAVKCGILVREAS